MTPRFTYLSIATAIRTATAREPYIRTTHGNYLRVTTSIVVMLVPKPSRVLKRIGVPNLSVLLFAIMGRTWFVAFVLVAVSAARSRKGQSQSGPVSQYLDMGIIQVSRVI